MGAKCSPSPDFLTSVQGQGMQTHHHRCMVCVYASNLHRGHGDDGSFVCLLQASRTDNDMINQNVKCLRKTSGKKKWKPDSQDQTPQNGSLVLFGFQFDSNELIQLLNYNFIVSKQTCKHYTSFLNQKSPLTFGQSIKFNPDQQWCILGNWDSTHSWICNQFLLKRSEHTPILDRLHRTADFLAVRQAR